MTTEHAERTVDRIIDDILGRRGLRQQWETIDDDIKAEIIARWVEIMKEEMPEGVTPPAGGRS